MEFIPTLDMLGYNCKNCSKLFHSWSIDDELMNSISKSKYGPTLNSHINRSSFPKALYHLNHDLSHRRQASFADVIIDRG